MTLKPNPPVRDDKLCAVCLGDRTPGKQCRDARLRAVLEDPFCSNDCAREFHGVVFAETSPGVRRTPYDESTTDLRRTRVAA